MQTSDEAIKAAIFHSDPKVRWAAIHYFSRGASRDPEIVNLAMCAADQFGLDAFPSWYFLANLVQNAVSASWIIDRLEQVLIVPDAEDHLVDSFVLALSNLDADRLRPYEERIEQLEGLDDDVKKLVRDRIAVTSLAPADLWAELNEYCAELDAKLEADDVIDLDEVNLDHGFALVSALRASAEPFRDEALELLDSTADGDRPVHQLMLLDLAGELRWEQAISFALDGLESYTTRIMEMAGDVLAKIGGDVTVEQVASAIDDRDEDFEILSADVLGRIHTDASLRVCLERGSWTDSENQMCFLVAALNHLDTDAIEPARQCVRIAEKSMDMLELRQELLAASQIMEVTFPEFEAWLADSASDEEFTKEWYGSQNYDLDAEDSDDDDWNEDDFDEDDLDTLDDADAGAWNLDEEDDGPLPPPDTIVKSGVQVGRNDPCPCGSGKKFKKCCYGKP